MSNLNSKFDVYKGWPNGSALELSVHPAVAGITEGKIVSLSSMSPTGTAAAVTQLDPSATAEIDMFVDPHASAAFVTAAITDDHVLDVCRNANADMVTLAANEHIFSSTYAGAKNLRGVVGQKRVRTTDADAFTVARTAQACSYFIRPMILKSEDASSTYLKADADAIACTAVPPGGPGALTRITLGTEFAGAAIGDVCHITGADTAGNNGLFRVDAVDVGGTYIDINLVYVADANDSAPGFQCQVYRPIKSTKVATCTAPGADSGTISSAAAFAGVLAGDVVVFFGGTETANYGTWIVATAAAGAITVTAPGGATNVITTSAVGDHSVAIFRPVASRGAAAVTVRKRITRLYDSGVDFITTNRVTAGKDQIVMPWPADTTSTLWDTTTTRWDIASVVDLHTLAATLTDLEELAPDTFVAPYAASAPYRIDLFDDVAKATVLTSARAQSTTCAYEVPDQAWLVVQGNDQFDGSFTDRVALVKIKTGIVWHVSTTIAQTLVAGDLVYSNAGVLTKVTRATPGVGGSKTSTQQQPVGMVIYSNNLAAALGEITVVGI